MMKMATGEGSPSDRVPEQGPDWFLVATEAWAGGTPDLGYFMEVSVFIVIFGVGLTSGVSPSRPRVRGAPPPSWLWCGPLWNSVGFFWSKNDLREISGQLDYVWFSFSAILKNKEKQKLALGSRLIG